MATMLESSNQTNGRQLLLKLYTERDTLKAGTTAWINVQQNIDKIVAQNFLEYLNR